MAYYFNPVNEGLISASSLGDGYSIHLEWNKAYLNNKTNTLAYHIYMSTEEEHVFSEGVKFISVDGSTSVDIYNLIPGQLYHFAVRAVEFSSTVINISQLPTTFNGLLYYPESVLSADITSTDTIIPLLDVSTFPTSGVIKVGVELINYLSRDLINNHLVLTNADLQRGFYNSIARNHRTDGYDGYHLQNPTVSFYAAKDETNTRIFPCQSRFEFTEYQYTTPDGYHQVTKDLLTTDLSGSDASNQNFPTYDYAGWHRTNPVDLLKGICVGSYIGGEMFCADGYSGVGRVVRGLSLQDQNNQRQEILLNVTGEPVCLLKMVHTGITCNCYQPSSEYADDRCPKCYGTKFIMGYDQFFNPRRSDGRILVRFSPADDDLKMTEAGLESELITDCWTLTVPTIKDRDVLIRFDQDGNEEFRYEVLSVNRNKTITDLQGAQKFKVQRIRKFDTAYQIRAFRNTEFLPTKLTTGIASVPGIPPHTHQIVINEKITMLSQISQTTSISQAHSHAVIAGIVQEVLGHSHTIVVP